VTAKNERACKDCLTERLSEAPRDGKVRPLRPAPFPGPRCHSHHIARQKASRADEHARKKERQFGLPPGGYAAMLDYQEGACAGCGRMPGSKARRLAVDHDHTCCPGNESCGQCVRMLLCYGCNDTLRHFNDDPVGLRRLADALEDWPSRHVVFYSPEEIDAISRYQPDYEEN